MGIERTITGRNELGGRSSLMVRSNGRFVSDSFVQDQDTRAIAAYINFVLDDTITIAASPAVNTYTVELTAGHGVIVGDYLSFLEQDGRPRIFFGKVLGVSVNTVTMDTPVPYAFTPAETHVLKYNQDLNVDGSTTAQRAYIENFFTVPIDFTRVIIHMTDNVEMDDATFGGISALTRGVVFRKKISDTDYTNYWNVKNNGAFGELAYDKKYDAKAPAGVYGMTVRLTYAGQDKHGVVIRVEPGEAVELLIQDDLTGLSSFNVMVEGHVVE